MSTEINPTWLTEGQAPQGSRNGAPKPTILAFHGSGSNSTIHTVQLARLKRLISDHFDVWSLEAPFPSPAGPGILPFFDGCGPFYRWIPPSEKVSLEAMRAGTSTSLLTPEVESVVRSAISSIQASGSYVIGLIGFSQGTRVVAGLLKASELRKEWGMVEDQAWCDFAFGVSVCGSYPPPLVPGWVKEKVGGVADGDVEDEKRKIWDRKIQAPVLHVQGTQDEWLWAGDTLIERYYEVGEGKSQRVGWENGHHYPVEAEDNETIAQWMIGTLGKVQARREAAR